MANADYERQKKMITVRNQCMLAICRKYDDEFEELYTKELAKVGIVRGDTYLTQDPEVIKLVYKYYDKGYSNTMVIVQIYNNHGIELSESSVRKILRNKK